MPRRSLSLRLALAALLAGSVAGLASSAAAAVRFHVTYDSFAAGQVPAPWNAVEWGGTFDGTPPLRDRVQPVTSPVAQGSQAVRIVVAPGDRFGSSTGERTLLKESYGSRLDAPVEGTTRYYGFSYYLPVGWVHPYEGTWRWEYIFEEHADSRFVQAPIKIGFEGDALKLRLNTGSCDSSSLCTERTLLSPRITSTHWPVA